MKIEHISKLILKFIGGGIVNFPTRFLKWIKVESCDCNGGSGDDGGGDDEGGDDSHSEDSVRLEDFPTFYISVKDDNYANTYQVDDTLQLSDIFDVPNINLLKGLLNLGLENVETNPDSSMYFNEYKNDPNYEEGWYNHAITLYPSGGESGPLQITTTHSYEDDGTLINETYDIGFEYDGEDTLTVSYVNPYEG